MIHIYRHGLKQKPRITVGNFIYKRVKWERKEGKLEDETYKNSRLGASIDEILSQFLGKMINKMLGFKKTTKCSLTQKAHSHKKSVCVCVCLK